MWTRASLLILAAISRQVFPNQAATDSENTRKVEECSCAHTEMTAGSLQIVFQLTSLIQARLLSDMKPEQITVFSSQ